MGVLLAPVIFPTLVGTQLTIAATAINVGLYVATTAASYLIQQANQPQQDIGTKLHAASGGAVNQSIVAGEKETAGSLIYAGSWGQPGKTPNGLYVRVYCLQDMPSTGYLPRCWTSDNKGTLDTDHVNYTDDVDADFAADGSGYSGSGQSIGHPITSLDHDGNHYAWVKILDGTQSAADPYLLAKFGVIADRPWTSSMIGRGRTIMIVTQRYTVKEANEVKNVTAVLQGMAYYDWRKDSTNGGSGSHRWGDASTYEYTGNPVVILYNVKRGIYRGNTWLYGGQNWPARRFDNDSWTAAANVCDQIVTLANGDTERRFRMGAEINLGEAPLAVEDRILATFSGRLVESGGVYKVYAGGLGASVYSFADDTVVITEPLTGTMFPGREDICNTITGTYCEPQNGGQMKAYRKRTKDEYVANDNGEPRAKQMDFEYVRSNTQAQRLALHALNDNRRFMTKVVAFPSIARKLEPGDPVNWSDSVRFGFDNKKWILGAVTLTNRGVVLCVLREADAADADWSVSDEQPYTVGVYGDIVPDSQTIEIDVTAFGKKDEHGKAKIPALRVTWPTDADMVDCKAVRWQYKRQDDPDDDLEGMGRAEFDEGKGIIEGLNRDTWYKVRAKIIPYSDRPTEYGDWFAVKTGDYRLDDGDIEPGSLSRSQTRRRNKTYNGVGATDDSNFLTIAVLNESGAAVRLSWEWNISARYSVGEAAVDATTLIKAALWKKHGSGPKRRLHTIHINVSHPSGVRRNLTGGDAKKSSKAFHDPHPKAGAVTTYGIDILYRGTGGGTHFAKVHHELHASRITR
jgi:hypothetical protein